MQTGITLRRPGKDVIFMDHFMYRMFTLLILVSPVRSGAESPRQNSKLGSIALPRAELRASRLPIAYCQMRVLACIGTNQSAPFGQGKRTL